MTTRSTPTRFGLLVAAVALISVNLRPGAAAIGPVLEEIRAGLGMSSTVAGAITGLPGLCFFVFGAAAVAFGRRVGMTAGIAIGLVAAAAGQLLRVLTDSETLFLLFTVLALAGMAVGNVLVPAWIKAHGHAVTLMTIYGTGLVVGGTLGAGLTAPMAEAGRGWQDGLGIWGIAVLVAVPLWAFLAVRERRRTGEHSPSGPPAPTGRITRSPTAVALAVLFGVQSMHAYVQFGWLPQIYRDAGLSASYAGFLQALVAAVGIGGALLMPTIIDRGRGLPALMVSFGTAMTMGYAGLFVAPATTPWAWAFLLGYACLAFPTAIALIAARTRHPAVTAQLSGFVQPVGYALAALGPFLVGLLHQATGSWQLVLVLLAVTAIPFTWAGLLVARPSFVDDEI